MRLVSVLALQAALAVPAPAAPPPEALALLGTALHALDEGEFVGSYTLTIEATVSTTGGKVTDTDLTVLEVTAPAGGPQTHLVVRAEKNGKDVTAEAQAEAAKEQSAEQKEQHDEGEEKEEVSFGFRLPEGDDARHYAFEKAECADAACTAPFAPTKAARKEKDLANGRLAWSPATGDPLWIEMTPADLPTGVKELTVRIEFERAGGLLYPARTITDGVGGILFIKRAFHAETAIDDLRVNDPTSAAAP
jgi:hypothetical protein